MGVPPDDVISREAKLRPLEEIAEAANLLPNEWRQVEDGIAKVYLNLVLKRTKGNNHRSRFVTVTAMTPYALGLGKSVTLVSVVQALYHLGYGVIGGIRQPNLGVTLSGIKGGAAGGGYSQIVPMEAFNTGLSGDEDRNTNATNNAMALINGLINMGSKKGDLPFDPSQLLFDAYAINAPDQAFRQFLMHPSGSLANEPLHKRQGYITVATEIQGVMAMANSYENLLERLGKIIIAPRKDGNGFVRFSDIYDHGIHHMLAGYLAKGLQPNLMQTLNGAPFLVHQGPFANISTGNNSVVADMLGLALAKDVFVTENGFGSDCGFHKIWNLVGSSLRDTPDVAVIVYTLAGLKYHGGIVNIKENLGQADPEALERGISNLLFHIEHCSSYGIPVIAVHNSRLDDQPEDLKRLRGLLDKHEVSYVTHEGYAKGGEGALELAEQVMAINVDPKKKVARLYAPDAPTKEKIAAYIHSIKGDPDKITYSSEAEKMIDIIDSSEEFRNLPLCTAKTHTSQTGNAVNEKKPDTYQWVGRHDGFATSINEVKLMAGAGYIVPVIGGMRLLPGVSPTRSVVNKLYFDHSLPEGRMIKGLG